MDKRLFVCVFMTFKFLNFLVEIIRYDLILRGYGITKTIESLEPASDYNYRLCVINSDNERSEYSSVCTVKTLSILLINFLIIFLFRFENFNLF